MATMHGCEGVTFLELVTDDVRAHGAEWTLAYLRKHGMAEWEAWWWLARVCGLTGDLVAFGG